MTETDNNNIFEPNGEELFEEEGFEEDEALTEETEEASPDPDVTPFTCWSYTAMQIEFADITRRIVLNGIDRQLAVIYAYKILNILDTKGYENDRFSEVFMAKTVYFRYVLANDIKLPPSPDARTLFNEYAALAETWGDRHYKGLELSKEDTDKLRADSYAVLSGLTKRTIEEEAEEWRPPLSPKLAPMEQMKLVEIISGETERLKKKYLLL